MVYKKRNCFFYCNIGVLREYCKFKIVNILKKIFICVNVVVIGIDSNYGIYYKCVI